jgi:hypothetical protein
VGIDLFRLSETKGLTGDLPGKTQQNGYFVASFAVSLLVVGEYQQLYDEPTHRGRTSPVGALTGHVDYLFLVILPNRRQTLTVFLIPYNGTSGRFEP